MKYNVLGIEHRVGSFTATAGKDAGKEISYDFYRLHCIKKSRENIGGVAVVPVALLTCSASWLLKVAASLRIFSTARLTLKLRNTTVLKL